MDDKPSRGREDDHDDNDANSEVEDEFDSSDEAILTKSG